MKKSIKITGIVLALVLAIFGTAFAIFPLPGQVPVLMYHFVGTKELARRSKNFVQTESLDKQMQFLKRFGYHVISIAELDEIKSGKRKPRGREIAITFDDGNETFAALAFPVLRKYEYPVMLFLITERMKRGTEGCMPVSVVQDLLKNPWIHIGSHTRTHPVLSELEESKAREELVGSRTELEQIFGRPIIYFAYPTGGFNPRVSKLVQEAGYRLAFTTSPKKLQASDIGPFSMLRVKISRSSDNPFVFWFKISGIYETFKYWRRQH